MTNLYEPRIGVYEKALPADMTWHERFKTVNQLGFSFIELSIDESDERLGRLFWNDEQINQIVQLSRESGVKIHSMCLSAHRRFPFGSADESVRRQARNIMQHAIALAQKLGIRVIQLAGYDVYYEPHTDASHVRFIEGMNYCAKLAEKAGIMLGVEIMDTDYLNSIGKYLLLKRAVDSPYFRVYPDVGNLTGWGNNVTTELRLGADHIVGVHLKDCQKVTETSKGKFRDMVIGDGDVDFKGVISTLVDMDCQVPLVIEMWAQNNEWSENLRVAKARIDDIVASINELNEQKRRWC